MTLLDQALSHHRAGHVAEAEALYRRTLAEHPEHPDALYLLGVLSAGSGRVEEGLALMRRAVTVVPTFAAGHLGLGNALLEAGRAEEAVAAYDRAIAVKADFAEAYCNRGVALKALGRAKEATASYRRAVEIKPDYVTALANLGNILQDQNALDEAVRCYVRALIVTPDHAETYYNLGTVCHRLDKVEEAVVAYRSAIQYRPDFFQAHANLGACLKQQDQLAEAEVALRRALALKPDFAAALENLGNVLQQQDRHAEALTCYLRALAITPEDGKLYFNLGTAAERTGDLDGAMIAYQQALDRLPDFAEAHFNLGILLYNHANCPEEAILAYRRAVAAAPDMACAWVNLGVSLHGLCRLEESIDAYRRAIALQPDDAETRHNLGLVLMLAGRLPEGLREFETRWETPAYAPVRRDFAQPQWDGAPFPGRTLLIHAEQGYGDTLQFCRYAPLAAALGGQVIIEAPAAVCGLLRPLPGVAQVVAGGQPLPPFDLHIPVLSLPLAFGTTVATIPGGSPYLRAEPARAAAWRARLGEQPGLRVGLVWAGNRDHGNDRRRSLALRTLSPLLDLPIRLFSLQREAAAAAEADGLPITSLSPDIHDFDDLAAAIEALDVLISVDSAPAHLAGALGKPVWLLLPFSPDWRWLMAGETTPWYASMRLYRQTVRDDWTGVVERVRADLANLIPAL